MAKITAFIGTKNDNKVQVEITEMIIKSRGNLLGIMNEGDAAFSAKPRKAWFTAEKSRVEQYFGVNVDLLTKGERQEADIDCPKLGEHELHIQLTDTTVSRTPEVNPAEDPALKRLPNEDPAKNMVFKSDNKLVFSYSDVVIGAAEHKELKLTQVPYSEVFASVTTANAVVKI